MSDPGRQSFTDKTASAMKPDSDKNAIEKLKGKIKETGDSTASQAQPESQKSTAQKMGDAVSGSN